MKEQTLKKNTIVIGLGEMAVSSTKGDVIKTMALGSCVGLVALDPKAKAVGMVHIVLPESSTNEDKAKELPGYFCDTGIPALFELMKTVGSKSSDHFMIKLIGGAKINSMEGDDCHFEIGKRNLLAVKKKLWSMKLGVRAEDVGGDISRTLSVDVNTGKVLVSHKGQTWQV